MQLTLSVITRFDFDSCCQLNLVGLCGTCKASTNKTCIPYVPGGQCPFVSTNYTTRSPLIVDESDSQTDLDIKVGCRIHIY